MNHGEVRTKVLRARTALVRLVTMVSNMAGDSYWSTGRERALRTYGTGDPVSISADLYT
jgi:hypothetical protein